MPGAPSPYQSFVASKYFLHVTPASDVYLSNGQNDRVANIEDVVQWGLGLLHQQAIFENGACGEIEKTSKVVPLCTACQFANLFHSIRR